MNSLKQGNTVVQFVSVNLYILSLIHYFKHYYLFQMFTIRSHFLQITWQTSLCMHEVTAPISSSQINGCIVNLIRGMYVGIPFRKIDYESQHALNP